MNRMNEKRLSRNGNRIPVKTEQNNNYNRSKADFKRPPFNFQIVGESSK